MEKAVKSARSLNAFWKSLFAATEAEVFHALVLLFSLGFRQGMIMGMKFQDVAVAMVGDPLDPTRRRLVTTLTIRRNKLRRDALEHKKGEKFKFVARDLD